MFTGPPDHTTASAGTASCLCDGLVCGACGVGRIHRPISDYYDEASGHLIHVAYFRAFSPCSSCGKRDWQQAGSVRSDRA